MTVQLKIDRLGHLGDGIAKHEGQEVFVPFTLPDETVEGELYNGRIDKPRILEPSSNRIKPACRHFKTCGGCATQHIADDVLANWKQQIVETTLEQQGIKTNFRPIAVSPPNSRRRAQFSARRGKKSAQVGFHMRGSDMLVNVEDCPVLDSRIMDALPFLRILTMQGASRKSEVRLSVTVTENGLDIDVSDATDLTPTEGASLAMQANDHKVARLTWNGEQVALINAPHQRFGAALVTPPPNSFLQATPQGEASLVGAVTEAIGSAKSVVDLFAGCGTFSLPAAKTAEVHAVESDAPMLAALDQGWRNAAGLKRVTTETRDLFRNPLMAEDLKRFDAAIVDPPRAGAATQTAELVQSKLAKVAFVSCNPATFSRDARVLIDAGFTLDWVQVIDQFRWSAHTELAAQFSR